MSLVLLDRDGVINENRADYVTRWEDFRFLPGALLDWQRQVIGETLAVGHGGEHIGYVAWAGCLPEEGSVVVVLSNRAFENVLETAIPLVKAVRSD